VQCGCRNSHRYVHICQGTPWSHRSLCCTTPASAHACVVTPATTRSKIPGPSVIPSFRCYLSLPSFPSLCHLDIAAPAFDFCQALDAPSSGFQTSLWHFRMFHPLGDRTPPLAPDPRSSPDLHTPLISLRHSTHRIGTLHCPPPLLSQPATVTMSDPYPLRAPGPDFRNLWMPGFWMWPTAV
jgi:hypothetical protein